MTDERLSKLEPEHVIKEYFTALNKKDVQTAKGCISKKTLLGKLTSNMPDDELFNEGYGLPLTDSDFSNLKSARLIESKLINDLDKNTKIFRITVDLQYDKVISIDNGKQPWDCIMVYESPQTGWKIDSFGLVEERHCTPFLCISYFINWSCTHTQKRNPTAFCPAV